MKTIHSRLFGGTSMAKKFDTSFNFGANAKRTKGRTKIKASGKREWTSRRTGATYTFGS